MANKFFAMVAIASIGSIAFATPTDWFNGGLGKSPIAPTNGGWTVPTEGVTTNSDNKLVLDDPATALAFAASSAKLPAGTNLTFTTTANFKYSYDELPTIDTDAKAGVVVYTNRFYVLGKSAGKTENEWKKTSLDAGTVDSEVQLSITVTNGNDKVFATYTIGSGSPINTEVYVKSDARSWSTVSYKGCGVVASLAGQFEQLGYPVPPGGGDPIPADRAEAWAEAQGISKAQLAAILASTTTYNGRTAAECCLIGILTNDTGTAAITDTKSNMLQLSVNCNPDADRVEFRINNGSGQKSKDIECELADGKYKVYARVDSGSWTQVSQEIGVKGIAVEKDKVKYIGAPWNDCLITNLLKMSCCAAGDKLEYYDASGNVYKSWTLTDGKWSDTDAMVTLKKGQAVKYTPASGGKLWAIGDVSSVNKTPIVAGDAWNLVASTTDAVAPASFLLSGEQAIVLGDDGVKVAMIYRKQGTTTKQKVSHTNDWEEVSGTISNGFFLKSPSRAEIEWPADAE